MSSKVTSLAVVAEPARLHLSWSSPVPVMLVSVAVSSQLAGSVVPSVQTFTLIVFPCTRKRIHCLAVVMAATRSVGHAMVCEPQTMAVEVNCYGERVGEFQSNLTTLAETLAELEQRKPRRPTHDETGIT